MLYALKNFSDLPLAPHLISNIQQNFGFSTMTRVQSLAIPEMVTSDSWRDVLVKSKTGTGKTLAYAVPILQDLQGIVPKISRSDGPYAIVLTPTRELAQQTYGVFQLLAKVSAVHTGGGTLCLQKIMGSTLHMYVYVLILSAVSFLHTGCCLTFL
jgi:ATP-dependent RNA helicase DDX31/DBP7